MKLITVVKKIQSKHAVALLSVLHCVAVLCAAQSTKHVLLALSKNNHMLAIADPLSLRVTAYIPVGIDPHEVVASGDGTTAYVTIYGGGIMHEINVLDLVSQKPLPSIDTRPLIGPHGIAFMKGRVWFTAEGSKSVGCYNPETKKLEWSLGTGQDRTHMIYVTQNTQKIYTTNVSSGTVSILTDTLLMPGRFGPPGATPREDWAQTLIPVSKGSEGFDVSPDSSRLWTASADDGSISIIDLKTKQLIRKIDAGAIGANRLKFTPDGKFVFISSLRSGDLLIYDAVLYSEKKRLHIGRGAAGIVMAPEINRAFVACTADNYIAVIDLNSLEVIGQLSVGDGPDGMAWVAIP